MSYLLDNCVIHRIKKLNEYATKEKMHLIYNVPYHSTFSTQLTTQNFKNPTYCKINK